MGFRCSKAEFILIIRIEQCQRKHTNLRRGSRILVRGGPVEFDPGGLSPKFAQNCLKTA